MVFLWMFSFSRFIQIMHSLIKKKHIKIFCSETSAEIIFSWPTSKIMCDTLMFYKLWGVKLKTRWPITGSSEPLVLGLSSRVHVKLWTHTPCCLHFCQIESSFEKDMSCTLQLHFHSCVYFNIYSNATYAIFWTSQILGS